MQFNFLFMLFFVGMFFRIIYYVSKYQGWTTDTDIRGRIRINGYGYGIFSFWTDTDGNERKCGKFQ